MGRTEWRPGNMLYPLPAVLVTTRNREGRDNVCTVAWTGTVCSDPAMVSISLRPSRLSWEYLQETGEFIINLTTGRLTRAADFCGVRSGRDLDKFEEMHLTKLEGKKVNCAQIAESPVSIECRVTEKRNLGSHTMFLAEVVSVSADDDYLDENGRFDLAAARPVVYSHGSYFGLGPKLGHFGFSVQRKTNKQRRKMQNNPHKERGIRK